MQCVTLRVQVPNYHVLTQNLYYNYYYPNPKYLTIGYMDPLGYKGLDNSKRAWGILSFKQNSTNFPET